MSKLSEIAKQALMSPKEALFEIKAANKNLYIGIPKETSFQENRIALTPLSVALLVHNGHEVLIESGAGAGANFTDVNYSEHGARIVYNKQEVYNADCIVKIAPPTMEEVDMMKTGQFLFSALQLSTLKIEYLNALMKKKVTAMSFEYLLDDSGVLSIVRAMGEIVGSTSILIAAEYLSTVASGKGLMLGGVTGVPSTEIVILGAGAVGEYATRTAIALGATVKVFDSSISRLRRLQNSINSRIYTSVLQPIILQNAIRRCDIAIGAIRATNGRSPCIISEETVSHMKPNSVIIDISIDQGGCFETSRVTNHTEPVFRKYNVIHYCVPNIASRVSRTASYALTNIIAPILIDIGDIGSVIDLIWERPGIRNSIYLYQGQLTNKDLAERFNIPLKDLELLIVATR